MPPDPYAEGVPGPRLTIPASIFAIPFGLAGLTSVWHLAATWLSAPPLIPLLLLIVTLIAWGWLLILYVRRLVTRQSTILTELNHPVTAPFIALIPVTLLVLVPVTASNSETAAHVITWVGLVVALVLGAWFTGRWLGNGVPEECLHSGYYLPTVAAGLIGATALATLGYDDAATMAFGLGGICWLLLGSVIITRNFVVTGLPPTLVPTMAIDVAPVVVAGSAWFVINDSVPDTVQLALAGFALLMVGVQFRLITVYRRLPFSASFWAFTFSYCAVASYGVRWAHTAPDTWATVASWMLVAAATALVAAIAVRSVISLRQGTFLPVEASAPAST